MAITLCHISAWEFWCSARPGTPRFPPVSHARSRISSLSISDENMLSKISRPIHVLVTDPKIRPRSKDFISHVWTHSLPKGYLLDIGNECYIASPELCFVQLAEKLPLLELIQRGYELCGTYCITNNEMYKCVPLTTVKRLKAFSKTAHIRGSKKACRALQYILDNSASPMETALAMLLCLPYKLGGYGIRQPCLNDRIEVDTTLNKSGYFSCDLYWHQAKLAVEYDSDQFHSGADHLTRDSIRRGDLEAVGIRVISVTKGQVTNKSEMEKIAHLVAKYTSKELRFTEPAFSSANAELRRVLFGR